MATQKNGRSTVYNEITSEEKLKQVNPENIELQEDFLEYLSSIDRAKSTITQYEANLKVFWCWNLEFNNNKSFVKLTKREIARFQNHGINEWGWSPSRLRTVKSTISSLSNYIENILDDEYKGFKPIVRKIETPVNEPVREKSVFTDEELKHILDVLVEKRQYMKACALALMIYGGRRKSEILRFKVSYFEDENLICSGALYKTPEKIKTKGRGQRGKMLYCYTLAKQFKPYFDLWLEEREKLGITTDWLFPDKENGVWLDAPAQASTLDSYARTFTAIAGKPFYPHCARHRACSRFVEAGIPANVIKDIFGWKDVSLVDIYSDVEAEDTFDKYFGADGIKQVDQKGIEDL